MNYLIIIMKHFMIFKIYPKIFIIVWLTIINSKFYLFIIIITINIIIIIMYFTLDFLN
jgi:hypothetical protein